MKPEPLSPDEHLALQLQRLLQAVAASGQAVLPRSNLLLLQSIVDAAARIFAAAAASIALVNEKDQTLDFKVSYGIGNEEVIGMRIPMDKGIAGYVAMTGQPIAISNVQQDPRFAQDFAKSTGYVPRSILATPLLSGERVIGVMEVLDKISAPSFGIQDMELLGMFASQAAIAIDQSQYLDQVGDALLLGLARLVEAHLAPEAVDLTEALNQLHLDQFPASDLQKLSDIFQEISQLGESERKACLEVLQVFARYNRSRSRLHR